MHRAVREISEYLTEKNIACQARETDGSGMVKVPFEGEESSAH